MPLSRDQILGADDRGIKRILVPEWGGEVCYKPLSARDRDAFEAEVTNDKATKINFRARMASRSICDEDGKLLFSHSDVEKLGNKSASALQRIFNELIKENMFSEQDVSELAGN